MNQIHCIMYNLHAHSFQSNYNAFKENTQNKHVFNIMCDAFCIFCTLFENIH